MQWQECLHQNICTTQASPLPRTCSKQQQPPCYGAGVVALLLVEGKTPGLHPTHLYFAGYSPNPFSKVRSRFLFNPSGSSFWNRSHKVISCTEMAFSRPSCLSSLTSFLRFEFCTLQCLLQVLVMTKLPFFSVLCTLKCHLLIFKTSWVLP